MEHHSEKAMPLFITIGFLLFMLGGLFGGMIFADKSIGQMVSWQVGNTGAICAAIIAAALLSKHDMHFPASGFIILGIVHGINFSSLVMDTIDERIFATSAIVIVPAIFFINYYKTFPIWVRITGWISSFLFLCMYVRMLSGDFTYGDWSQTFSYMAEQVTMVGWIITFWKVYGKNSGGPAA